MNAKVVDLLKKAMAGEHRAIAQYMTQHYVLDGMGYKKLADLLKKNALDEMKHTEGFGERLVFLEGTPSFELTGKVEVYKDIKKILKSNIILEEECVKSYNEAALICADKGDAISRKLFEDTLKKEEEHLDSLRTTLELLEKFGDAYLIEQT